MNVSPFLLLRPVEYPRVRSLAADLAGPGIEPGLTRGGYGRIWTLRIRCNDRNIQHRVQSIKLQYIMMERTGSRCARTSVAEAAGANLLDLIFEFETVGTSRCHVGHGRRNIPHQ